MADQITGRDEFAHLIREELRKAGETAEVVYDPEQFQLRVEGKEGRVGNLGNVYSEYRTCDQDARERLVRNYVRSWFAPLRDMPADFEDVNPDLLPTVRSRAYVELNLRRWRAKGVQEFGWPYRILGEHLALSLVYDLPGSLMQIQQRHLDAWKVDFDEALARAVENLAAVSGHEFEPAAPGVWRSPWRDNLDPSRLALPDLLRAHQVRGDPVVMVPNRDTLLLTGADDEEGLTHLVDLAEAAFEEARPITGLALRLVPDGWVAFLPGPGHPAHSRYHLLHIRSIAHDYAEQKELLDEINREAGDGVFVATYSALQETATGQFRSYCVWSEGADALLPETDQVFFVRAGEDQAGEDGCEVVAAVSWQRVEEELGNLMTPAEEYPPRWRVREFPDPALLARLDERGAE